MQVFAKKLSILYPTMMISLTIDQIPRLNWFSHACSLILEESSQFGETPMHACTAAVIYKIYNLEKFMVHSEA